MLYVQQPLPPASVYRDEEKEADEGSEVGMASHTHPLQLSGPEALARMKTGTRVVRGKDWKWGNQVRDSGWMKVV